MPLFVGIVLVLILIAEVLVLVLVLVASVLVLVLVSQVLVLVLVLEVTVLETSLLCGGAEVLKNTKVVTRAENGIHLPSPPGI